MKRLMATGLIIVFSIMTLYLPASAQTRMRLATTTSTVNSGLLDQIVPLFEKSSGIKVDVISVGTGKALKLGQRCDVDMVMVHAPALEKKFVADGHGVDRRGLMYNYFCIVGPAGDPAGIKQAANAAQAFKRISESGALFISRGDNSGTNVKERDLWNKAGVKPAWPGYKEAGRGMGAVLTMAGQMKAYTLTDTGTFLKYKSVGKLDLEILFSAGAHLKNPYSVIMVNPKQCPQVKTKAVRAFIKYLISVPGQKAIADYRAGGRQLFWPDAR